MRKKEGRYQANFNKMVDMGICNHSIVLRMVHVKFEAYSSIVESTDGTRNKYFILSLNIAAYHSSVLSKKSAALIILQYVFINIKLFYSHVTGLWKGLNHVH
ncbi:hypothetical protein NPIL_47301 [Nephila pilipes]|uniref:Uncharacterized protein n=1 Tax=Nephila pilipes TaxID=299642 RepID=A0A8X6PKB2_NEPPI|nr:hypothetical protein NPIL_47301 [Nephila pilipes]